MSEVSSEKKLLVRRINLARSQLKASARASALLAGFAMVALVEISIDKNEDKPIPLWLLSLFVVNTAFLIGTHMVALMISTFLLPIIESYLSSTCYATPALMQIENDSINSLHRYILASWFLSTVIGICLFLLEIPLICWVKFWNYSSKHGLIISMEHGPFVALLTTMFVVPIFVTFILVSYRFYRELVHMHLETTSQEMKSFEKMLQEFEEHRRSFAQSTPTKVLTDLPLSGQTISETNIVGDPALVAMLPILTDGTRRRQSSIDNSLGSE